MSEPFDEFTAIQLIALKSREAPTLETEYRKICRWFSEKFCVPLNEVEELDMHYVLLHRFEDYIQSMEEKDYNAYKRRLLHNEAVAKEEQEDDDWVKKEVEALRREQKKLTEAAKAPKEPEKLNLSDETVFDLKF